MIAQWRLAIQADVSINYLLEMGYALLKNGDAATALERFQQAQKAHRDPESAFAMSLARIAADKNDRDPYPIEGLEAGLKRLEAPGRQAEADAILSLLAEQITGNRKATHAAAALRLAHGRVDDALALLNASPCTGEDRVTVSSLYFQVAQCLMKESRLGEALDIIAGINAGGVEIQGMRLFTIHTWMRRGNLEEAHDAALKLIETDESWRPMFALGEIELMLGLGLESVKRFQCAHQLLSLEQDGPSRRSTLAMIATSRGLALQAAGQLEEAGECHREAMSLHPINVTFASNLGLVRLAQQKINEARDLTNQGLNATRTSWLQTNCALVAMARGEIDLANQLHRIAYAAEPTLIWLQARKRPWVWKVLREAYNSLGFKPPE